MQGRAPSAERSCAHLMELCPLSGCMHPEPTDEAAAADVDQDRSGLHHAQPANGGQMAAQLTAAWVRTLHAARRHSLGAAGA